MHICRSAFLSAINEDNDDETHMGLYFNVGNLDPTMWDHT